jgi:hypothetical protein
MDIHVAAGEVVAGDAEEVEGLIIISTAAVVIMAIDHRGRGGHYDDGGGGQGGMVGGITTDMMVTVADMADPQVEDMEMDPSVQVDHRRTAFLLPHLQVVLRWVCYPSLSG